MRPRLGSLLLLPMVACLVAAGPAAPAPALSPHDQGEVVAALTRTLATRYVFPDVAPTIIARLDARLRAGAYAGAVDPAALARALTDDLIAASGDLHFAVGVDPAWVAEVRAEDDPVRRAASRARVRAEAAATNFGFESVSRLEGNVGYVRATYFADPELGYRAAAAAMRMIEETDAVIFDLRANHGGAMEMVQLLASYLLSAERDQLLFDYYYVQDGRRVARGQWVLPAVPGPRMLTQPVFILTASTTFSAAEWFAYVLQRLGRATVIGAPTGGGAHPVDRVPIDDQFYLQLPIGQIYDPVDHGDFEGRGVQPDVPVASRTALVVAHRMALARIAARAPARAAELAWLEPVLAARLRPPTLEPAALARLVGNYQGRELTLDDGHLVYHWRGRFRLTLEPLTPDLFAVEGIDDFRLKVVTAGGKVVGLERINQTGPSQIYPRRD
ncbi:MAG: S41 family peptidase [Kofleriaceae bacterium]